MIIGITGGSGCGKTTMLDLIREKGGLVLDCDAIYHQLLLTDPQLLQAIENRFPGVVEQGQLQRKKLGAIVFSDENALRDLNKITHAAVKAEVLRQLATQPKLAAIDAINRIPSRVELKDEATVLAARAAYDKVLSKAQQALVTNFSTLLSAEQRLVALKAAGEEQPPVDEPITDEEEPAGAAAIVGAVIACMVPVGMAGIAVVNAKARKEDEQGGEEAPETETEEQ